MSVIANIVILDGLDGLFTGEKMKSPSMGMTHDPSTILWLDLDVDIAKERSSHGTYCSIQSIISFCEESEEKIEIVSDLE